MNMIYTSGSSCMISWLPSAIARSWHNFDIRSSASRVVSSCSRLCVYKVQLNEKRQHQYVHVFHFALFRRHTMHMRVDRYISVDDRRALLRLSVETVHRWVDRREVDRELNIRAADSFDCIVDRVRSCRRDLTIVCLSSNRLLVSTMF